MRISEELVSQLAWDTLCRGGREGERSREETLSQKARRGLNMAQWVNCDDSSSVPRTHTLEQVDSSMCPLISMCTEACTPSASTQKRT